MAIEEGLDLRTFLQDLAEPPNYGNYSPLSQSRKEIRLLRIWLEDGLLHGFLQTASLYDDPEYDALSYYWGPPGRRESIHIDGQEVLIQMSLYTFLDVLCRNGQRSRVWVDSLCINQSQVDEKSWQVTMMADIYKHAAEVKAWIGNSDADSEYALFYMQNQELLVSLELPAISTIRAKVRESFRRVMMRPYWERLWVVQELASAKMIVVVCGQSNVAWSRFVDMVKAHNVVSQVLLQTV